MTKNLIRIVKKRSHSYVPVIGHLAVSRKGVLYPEDMLIHKGFDSNVENLRTRVFVKKVQVKSRKRKCQASFF